MGRNLILITRPISDAEEFAAEVRMAGFETLVEPMLGLLAAEYKLPDFSSVPALVFTSANAVRVFGCPVVAADIFVFAVGNHTAEAARKAGFTKIFSAEGDGAGLAAMIKKKLTEGPARILHIRGEHTARPLDELLASDRIVVDSLVVYTAQTEDKLSPVCRDALVRGDIQAVTFFSKRTAENFVKLITAEGLNGNLANIKALCISPAVLECVQAAGWPNAYSAAQPDRQSMLDLMRGACLTQQ